MKTTMQRSIVFTKPQMKWLEDRAKTLGITISDVIRRLVDRQREDEAQTAMARRS